MSRWRIEYDIVRATGVQVYIVEAGSKEEAISKRNKDIDTELELETWDVIESKLLSVEEE